MMRSVSRSKLSFGSHDVLKGAAFFNLLTALLFQGFLLLALRSSLPYLAGAIAGVILSVWAWRSRRWGATVLFLLFTVAFWVALILPLFFGE